MNHIDILKKLKLNNYYINKYRKNPSKKLYKENLGLIKKYYQTKKKVQKGGSKVIKETNQLLKMISDLLNDKDIEIGKIKTKEIVNKKSIKTLEKVLQKDKMRLDNCKKKEKEQDKLVRELGDALAKDRLSLRELEAKLSKKKDMKNEKQLYEEFRRILKRFQEKILKNTKKSYWPLIKFKDYVKTMMGRKWKNDYFDVLHYFVRKETSPYIVKNKHLEVDGVKQYITKRMAPKKVDWR